MPVTPKDRGREAIVQTPDQRGSTILTAVINEHFITGEPVGSKALAERFANASGLSSATIRGVMAELEELGLLEQPHTSAGRVPTDRGYRFFVDNLLGVLSLSSDDVSRIGDEFGLTAPAGETPDRLMERTSHLLSALSNNIGIVVSPSFANDRLQHIEFVNLSENRILVVLVSTPNIVHNRIIRLNVSFTRQELEKTANYLNSEFAGKSLAEIRAEIMQLMHQEKALFDKLLQTAVILCSGSIEDGAEGSEDEVFIDGTSNLLTGGDFADLERLRELLATISERSKLVQILNECIDRGDAAKDKVQVMIGSENRTPSLQNCTLISAPYRIGNSSATGTLTVLGPTRMEYARMISIVSYVARTLEKVLGRDPARN